jgi:hypothetical protein
MAKNYDDSFLTVNNIETYHAGYKDRNLIWCKTYFTMINADPEFEMMHEIDKWRLIAFIMLELQIKKPVPLNREYLKRKGIDNKLRPISLTIQMLHNFITVVTQEKSCRVVEKRREENIKKSIKEEEGFVLPDWINKEDWNGFVAMRIKIKKPMTDRAKQMAVDDLIEMCAGQDKMYDPVKCSKILTQSEKFNWQGLFEPKDNGSSETPGKELTDYEKDVEAGK